MEILLSWLINAIAIFITASLLPGIHTDLTSSFITAIVLGVINAFIKPILIFLTLPINVLTLGLFTLVINALLILLASNIVTGFKVDGFWWALIFSVILSIVNSFLHSVVRVRS